MVAILIWVRQVDIPTTSVLLIISTVVRSVNVAVDKLIDRWAYREVKMSKDLLDVAL